MNRIEKLALTIIYIANEDDCEKIGKAVSYAVKDGQLSLEDGIILASKYSALADARNIARKEKTYG